MGLWRREAAGKLFGKKDRPVVYDQWLKKHLPSQGELERQRREKFSYCPLFSVVVPLYRTPEPYLEKLIQSVQAQTYGKWELCLSDGSGPDSPLREILERYIRQDSRIRVRFHDQALKIAENTNEAIRTASGDYLVFADHDDALTPDALYAFAKAANENPETDIFYSDEDKMSMDGGKFFQPHMKPDFNPDLLCTVNYICHLFAARKELVERLGGLRPEYDGGPGLRPDTALHGGDEAYLPHSAHSVPLEGAMRIPRPRIRRARGTPLRRDGERFRHILTDLVFLRRSRKANILACTERSISGRKGRWFLF